MQGYQYKVAISFAGEQRGIAEVIAACVKRAGGGPVFYDKDERAKLWGKDLYEHLVEVYRDKAEYCIIIASKEYLEKEWTVHERKSAQARALENKGKEYILPVDYDGTRLPGLLETIGYLSYADEGVQGVCRTFLEKIGMVPSPMVPSPPPVSGVSIASSPRAALMSGKTILFVPVARSSWGSTVSLLLEPDDPADGPMLSDVRSGTRPVLVAYQQNVALCRLEENTHSTEGAKSKWELKLLVEEDSFRPDMEAGTSGISAEQFAEQRARRLLLNENPARETEDMNEIFLEVLRRGQGIAKIERSPFPDLFKSLGLNPLVFLESAWITAAMQLRLSGCVMIVNSLKLELKGTVLAVDFVGTRHRKYTNVDPYVIRIKGECSLQG